MPQSYCLETQDTELLLAVPLCSQSSCLLEPLEAGPSGRIWGCPCPHRWSEQGPGVEGGGAGAGSALRPWSSKHPGPVYIRLPPSAPRGSAAHPHPHPGWLPRKENRRGSHQSGAQAGEPDQDKGHPSASGAKAGRDPRTGHCDNRQRPTHSPKAPAQNQAGWAALFLTKELSQDSLLSAPSEPPAQQKAFWTQRSKTAHTHCFLVPRGWGLRQPLWSPQAVGQGSEPHHLP